jgi:GT2 family glycosyltransferase
MTESPISVTIVTWNSARDITRCLDSLAAQTVRPREVVVVDNASDDDSASKVEAHPLGARLLRNDTNLGFTAGHNRTMAETGGPWVLVLNPDVVLSPDFLEQGLAAAAGRERVGSVAGKLLRMPQQLPEGPTDQWPGEIWRGGIIDSTGILVTPQCRHLDRGAGEKDRGQYQENEFVFGVSGAAALYRRKMLEETAVGGQFFDEDFWSFREDADLSWRSQLMGWDTIYWPAARALHRRSVTPRRRRQLDPAINRHSVKNRFLLRIKNQTAGHALRFLFPTLYRDLLVLGALFTVEWSSLPALPWLWRNRRRIVQKRKEIMARRSRPDGEVNHWFRRGRDSRPAG